MEFVRFKVGLFGFRRKQVLTYIDQTCAAYESKLQQEQTGHMQEMAALQAEFEEKLRTHRDALVIQIEENVRLDRELAQLGASLDEKYTMLTQEQEKSKQLADSLEDEKSKVLQLAEQLAITSQQHDHFMEENQKLKRDAAAKDHIIADQTVELNRLKERVSHLGEAFDSMQEETEQSQAMVDCMNRLHERNRTLSAKVAQLEAQMQEAGSEQQVKQFEAATTQKQELLKNTETLFTAVRKEIQEALQSISLKIDSDTQADSAHQENFYVDMAEL